ncbi:MAG: serine/threonine-protein kinase [Deltaproteobacteria bacterium]
MAGSAANVAPGEVIGAYELERLLGAGSTSKVFLGRHKLLGRQAAIKVLAQELVSNQDVVHRLLTEARVVNDIRHPNIIDIIDFVVIEKPRRVALVMEVIEGPSLMTLRGFEFTHEQALGIVLQLVDAVGGAHAAGVIHRDIKPDNLLLQDDPRESPKVPTLKVVDFGIAKLAGKSGRTATGMMLGTPAYMAPEQVAGRPPPSTATDVFAIGEVLYEVLAGERAYPSKAIHETVRAKIRGELPDLKLPDRTPNADRLMQLIVKCLERRPEDRPSIDDVKETLVDLFPSNWRPSASLAERLIANTLGTGPHPVAQSADAPTTQLEPLSPELPTTAPREKKMSILALPNVDATMDPSALGEGANPTDMVTSPRADEITDRSADQDLEYASTQLAFEDESGLVNAPTLPPVARTELASAAGLESSGSHDSLKIDTVDTAVTMLGADALLSPAGVQEAPETNPQMPAPTAELRGRSRLTQELELAVDQVTGPSDDEFGEPTRPADDPELAEMASDSVIESGQAVDDPAKRHSPPSVLLEPAGREHRAAPPRKSRVWTLIIALWIVACVLLAVILLMPKKQRAPTAPTQGIDKPTTPIVVGPITINSDPQGATVTDVASSRALGETPLELTEKQRRGVRLVRIEKSGYKSATVDLSSTSGNVWMELDAE